MKAVFVAGATIVVALSFRVGMVTGTGSPPSAAVQPKPTVHSALTRPVSNTATSRRPRRAPSATTSADIAALDEVIDAYCIDCHSDQSLYGNLTLEGYTIARADTARAKSEKMIRKLRAEMMPLPGRPRPGGDTLRMIAEAIEKRIDGVARPNPGSKTFQRLNRAEYERAIRDLLAIEVNAGDYLPLDTKSANFDNIADVQMLSPTLLEAYLNAAAAVSRMAVGDSSAPVAMTTYRVSPYNSQHPWDHVEGAPFGTRGGLVTEHTFVADGDYEFRFNVGGGTGTRLEDIDVSIDGARVALLKYERGVNRSVAMQDLPLGVDLYRTEPIRVAAGSHKVSVAFVRRGDGPYEDLIKPTDWSAASNASASAGATLPPHILDVSVVGPQKTSGVSETPSRRIVFSCRPSPTLSETACAEQIINRLGTRAYRRALTKRDVDGLLGFYSREAKTSGFEGGVRAAVQAMLASPQFVFRFENAPANAVPGHDYRISDYELATRLSFFLWSSIPDERLLKLAQTKQLSAPGVMEAEVKRMLADPRAEAISTRFAGQWLRLQDIEKVRPDAFWFPDYDEQLGQSMRRETELFFNDIVKRDRPILELLTSRHTFVNERLARHYGIPNVSGERFRRVAYTDSARRGILGQGSMLVQTSVANRTSPVLRGKWVMEVLIGMPPPPPPPNVPSLDETAEGKDGKPLTTRERMELHRASQQCRTCHQYMDPLGLALDNFDVTGKWRYRETGSPLDTRGTLWDGSPVSTPSELTKALVKRPTPFVRTFAENLMAYAIGRRVEDEDQTSVRVIAKSAAMNGYRFSSFVTGVVNTPAFRMRRAEPVNNAVSDQPQR
jgi:hypothetical protein